MVCKIDAAFLFAEGIGKAVFLSGTEPRPIVQIAANRRAETAKAVFLKMKGQRPAVCVFHAKRPIEPIRAGIPLLVFKVNVVPRLPEDPDIPARKMLVQYHATTLPTVYMSFELP